MSRDNSLLFAERQMQTMVDALSVNHGRALGCAIFVIAAFRIVGQMRRTARYPRVFDRHALKTFREAIATDGGPTHG